MIPLVSFLHPVDPLHSLMHYQKKLTIKLRNHVQLLKFANKRRNQECNGQQENGLRTETNLSMTIKTRVN